MLDIIQERVHYIIVTLNYKKMCNLQQLTSPCEKNISEEFLSQCYLEGDDLLMNFNTASECWIYHYDPENKRRFMEYQTFCLTEWQLLPKGPAKPYEHSANTSAGLGLKKRLCFVLWQCKATLGSRINGNNKDVYKRQLSLCTFTFLNHNIPTFFNLFLHEHYLPLLSDR